MRRFQIIMTTRVKSLLAALEGGEDISKFYTIISHEITTAIPILPSLFVSQSFACLHSKNLLCTEAVTQLFDGVFYRDGSYGRICYTVRTHHDIPVRTLSSSLSNFSAGRMARLFSKTLVV
jgi:hypothetical protein